MKLDLKTVTGPEGVTIETFICRCSTEQTALADALQAEVRQRLELGEMELLPRVVTDKDFVTMVVQSLEWDMDHVQVTGIWNDQWSLLTAEDHAKTVSVRVQCDMVEDGFAAAWKIFADRKWPREDL